MVDGLQKIGPIVSAAAANNMPALAPTDQMNMCGLVRFYGSAHGRDQAPGRGGFLGAERRAWGRAVRLTLLAMDNDGYQNITLSSPAAISAVMCRGPRHRQGLAWRTCQGVIVLSGGREGMWASSCSGQPPDGGALPRLLPDPFPGCLLPGAAAYRPPGREVYLHMAVAIASEFELPVVATNEVVFTTADDFDAPRIGSPSGRLHPDGQAPTAPLQPQRYLRSQEEMAGCLPTSRKPWKTRWRSPSAAT